MFCFVILHYKNIDDTLECINSIKNITDKKRIIVVDNATLDSDEKEKLKDIVDDLICLENNIGFAKANNIGVKLAKEKYNPEYIAVINNDTVIDDTNWINKIENTYQQTNFDILGPYIICEKGLGSVNPYRPLKNLEEINGELKYQQKLLKIYSNKVLYGILIIYLKIKRIFIKAPIPENANERINNVALHGCALIFAQKYFDKYEYAFYNETFLFHEESFLWKRIVDDNLTTIYEPTIKIVHKEGQSTKSLSNQNKMIFRTKEIIKSLNLLKEIYEREENI